MGSPRPLGHVRPIMLGTITTVAIAVAWNCWHWLDDWTAISPWEDEMAPGPRTDVSEAWQEIRWYGPATET
jgi:hypothetical protein